MKAFLSYLLISLVLLQTFSREVLVVDFALNRAAITARFCVNKARPQLHCDGKCYFAKQLKQQEERENRVPSVRKEKLEMLPVAFSALVPSAPAQWAPLSTGYAPHYPANLLASSVQGVFQPPRA